MVPGFGGEQPHWVVLIKVVKLLGRIKQLEGVVFNRILVATAATDLFREVLVFRTMVCKLLDFQTHNFNRERCSFLIKFMNLLGRTLGDRKQVCKIDRWFMVKVLHQLVTVSIQAMVD